MKYILTFVLIILAKVVLQAQNIELVEVTYKLQINLNTLTESVQTNYTPSQQESIKREYKKRSQLDYTLLFNNNEALFFLSDSIVSLYHDNNDNILKKFIKTAKNKKYYKNIQQNKSIFQKEVGGESLLITAPFNDLNWQLTNTSKKIGNYMCYRAVLKDGHNQLLYDEKMVIEAWYTPEIPIPFGPFSFEGLPGLILELQLGRNVYYAANINFASNHKINALNKGKVVSRDVYSAYLLEQMSEVFNSKD